MVLLNFHIDRHKCQQTKNYNNTQKDFQDKGIHDWIHDTFNDYFLIVHNANIQNVLKCKTVELHLLHTYFFLI